MLTRRPPGNGQHGAMVAAHHCSTAKLLSKRLVAILPVVAAFCNADLGGKLSDRAWAYYSKAGRASHGPARHQFLFWALAASISIQDGMLPLVSPHGAILLWEVLRRRNHRPRRPRDASSVDAVARLPSALHLSRRCLCLERFAGLRPLITRPLPVRQARHRGKPAVRPMTASSASICNIPSHAASVYSCAKPFDRLETGSPAPASWLPLPSMLHTHIRPSCMPLHNGSPGAHTRSILTTPSCAGRSHFYSF